MTGAENVQRYCRECGRPLAPGAAFCRDCGAATKPVAAAAPAATETAIPPPPPPAPTRTPEAPKQRRRRRVLLPAALVALLIGGGAAAAIVLLGNDDSSQEEVAITDPATIPAPDRAPTRTEEASAASAPNAPAVGTIGAGRYVQAGSFKTVAGAEGERERLEAEGIRVIVADSAQAEELYPGFQVLLAGPFTGDDAERAVLRRLHEEGVPSAFARGLSPAREIAGPEAVVGQWSGSLERTGGNRREPNGSLPVTLSAAGSGQAAHLRFRDLNCEVELTLSETTEVALAYGQEGECVGAGEWDVRPSGDEISLVLLPPDTEVIVLGTLYRR